MPKIILSVIAIAAIALYFVMPSTFAQTFFGPESSSSSNKPLPTSNAPISADSFKNRVQQLNQQTEKSLTQRAKTAAPVTPAPQMETSQPFLNQQPGQTPASPAAPSTAGTPPLNQRIQYPNCAPRLQAVLALRPKHLHYTGFTGSGSTGGGKTQ